MQFFYDKHAIFEMWGPIHLLIIGLIVVLLWSLYFFRKQLIPHREKIRLTIGIGLLISRLSLDIWYISTDSWNVRSSLPFELCSIASIVCAFMLLTKNHYLFEFVYFLGIAGAIQAIITPDLLFGFPQFRFWQFFLDHFLLISGPLVMVWLFHFTVSLRSILKAFIALNGVAITVFIINLTLDANYMFLKQKPKSISVLDFLGPYPFYIISLEFIALFIFIILYIPFEIKHRQKT